MPGTSSNCNGCTGCINAWARGLSEFIFLTYRTVFPKVASGCLDLEVEVKKLQLLLPFCSDLIYAQNTS